MTHVTNQIAAFLNVAPSQIVKITEMAWVYVVVVAGRKARFVSKKVVKMVRTDSQLANDVAKAIKATGNYANVWEKNGMTRVYVKGAGGAGGYIVIEDGELEFRLTGYGQSQVIGNAAKAVVAA